MSKPPIDDEEQKILDLFRSAKEDGHAELVIQVQDGIAVSARITRKVKL